MRAFSSFLKKEILENVRSPRFAIVMAIFVLLGIMNPAVAKLTPWLLELLAEDLAASGMQIGNVTADALASWSQFYKNIPMAIIAFVFMYSNVFTKEYADGTLTLILTKGLARYKVVLAKSAVASAVWTLGYWLCYAVTQAGTAMLWDSFTVTALLPAGLYWWLFGLLVISLTVLFSVIFKSYVGVLMGTGGAILAIYLLSLIPKLAKYVPTALMNGTAIVAGVIKPGEYTPAVIISSVLTVCCIAAAIPIFNKKQL